MHEPVTDEEIAEYRNAKIAMVERAMANAIGAFLQAHREGEPWESGKHIRSIGEAVEGLLRLLPMIDEDSAGAISSLDGMGNSWVRVVEPNRFEIAGLMYTVGFPHLEPFAAWVVISDDAQQLVDYSIRYWDIRQFNAKDEQIENSLYLGTPGQPPTSWKLKYRLRKQDLWGNASLWGTSTDQL